MGEKVKNAVNKALDAVLLSVVFVVCCLPVVTAGSAWCALYYAAVKSLRRGEGSAVKEFWRSFRMNLRVGALSELVMLAFIALLAIGYVYLTAAASEGGTVWFRLWELFIMLLIFPLSYAETAFVLLSRFEYSVFGLLKAVFVVMKNALPRVLVSGLVCVALLAATVKLPYILVISPAVGAIVISLLMEPTLRSMTPVSGDGEVPWYLRK